MKCGEERPGCLRCTSTGRKCDGYELAVAPWRPPPGSVWHVITGPSPNQCLTPKQQRSLQFFREQTVPQMNAFFSDVLWSDLIPQLAHQEPSVGHALSALSWFQEQLLLDGAIKSRQFSFGLQEYNMAIRKLLDTKKKQTSPLIGLLCCLLFVATEVCSSKSPRP